MVKGRTSREEEVSMSSEHALNPTGGVLYRRTMEEPSSDHQLLEHILSPDNIREAWKQVRSNKGSPGIDGITVDEFPEAFRGDMR
jgi:RNA-directed DNA polymerase